MQRPNIRAVLELQRVAVRDGVVLRPLATEDAAALLAIFEEDPTIRERVGIASRIHSTDDVKKILAEETKDADILRYVISEKDLVVGMVNFWRAGDYFGDKADPDDYGFGYFLAPSARGRGLVTDSLRVLMDIAAEVLQARTFIAFCEADNAASGALLKKAGLEVTGEKWVESENGWLEQKYQRIIPQ